MCRYICQRRQDNVLLKIFCQQMLKSVDLNWPGTFLCVIWVSCYAVLFFFGSSMKRTANAKYYWLLPMKFTQGYPPPMAPFVGYDRGQKDKQKIIIAKFGTGLSLGRIRFQIVLKWPISSENLRLTRTCLLRSDRVSLEAPGTLHLSRCICVNAPPSILLCFS